MGMKSKKTSREKATKKQILPTVKGGGALLFLPMLGVLVLDWQSDQYGESGKRQQNRDDSSKNCNIMIVR